MEDETAFPGAFQFETFIFLLQLVFELERFEPEVEPSRTSLASKTSSRTHFQVLGLGLEASSPWPWPRSLRSSKIALSSARGQHYFFNRSNFVVKHQKPGGKFANTCFVFLNWSIGVARGRQGAQAPPQSKFRQ